MTSPDISIVIPIYNDKIKIGQTIEKLAVFFNNEKIKGEIIIVNDGGQDGGINIVNEKIQTYPRLITLIDRKNNKGKGYTVREGMKKTSGNYIFFTDADLPYLTQPIKEILETLKTGAADMVLASRDLKQSQDEKPGWPRQFTHVIYSHFVRTLIPIPFTDTLAGLKGMTKAAVDSILPRLTINRFSFDVELLLIASKLGFHIKELPVSLKNVGRSNLSIRRDAPEMIKEIIQIRRQLRRGYYD